MKKLTKYLLVAVAIVSAVLVLEIIVLLTRDVWKNSEDPSDASQYTETQGRENSKGNTESGDVEQSTEPIATSEDPVEATESTTVPETETTTPTETPSTQPTARPTQSPEVTETPPEPTVHLPEYITFPYIIPGSSVMIEQVNSYDGLFLEDGSDIEVNNVTALVLTNTGDECAEYIRITLISDEEQLQFEASALEPGGTVIVIEATAEEYRESTYSKCIADIASMKDMTMSENQLRVEEDANGGLIVTNISDTDIPCVRIFYKLYMSDMGVYVGGITYTAKIDNLKSGEERHITPSHYLQGYSKIVMIKTYDSNK